MFVPMEAVANDKILPNCGTSVNLNIISNT